MRDMRPADHEVLAVIDSMAFGYLSVDEQWRVQYLNSQAEQILGSFADDLIGKILWDEFPQARELELGQVAQRVHREGGSQSAEAYYPYLQRWFRIRAEPAGSGVGVYFLDVTDLHVNEERAQLLAARARLGTAVADALNASLDVRVNVGTLAKLGIPYLGSWAIVSLVEDDGRLVDAGAWHVNEAMLPLLQRYVSLRLDAFIGESLPAMVARTAKPLVIEENASQVICALMRPGPAPDLLAELAPTSCAILPMVAHGRTVGLISFYDEAPWDEDQHSAARDIAERAALSLDNSMAYAAARVAQQESEEASNRLAFYATISEALSTARDPDEAISRLAHMIVPLLADWCVITVVDDDGVRRDIAWAHRDPSRLPDVAAYATEQSAALSDDAPVSVVLRTGELVVIRNLSEQEITSYLPDPKVAELSRKLDPHGAVVVPLTVGGNTFGVISLVTTHERGSHTDTEISTALEVARRVAPVLENARAALRVRRVAETMQRSMLSIPGVGSTVQIATHYRPATVDRQVGGDWYDAFTLPDDTTVLSIGDVMGHDVAAIAAMAQLRTSARAMAWALRCSPAQVLHTTDAASFAFGPASFATMLVTQFSPPADDGSVRMQWANAGHLPPLVRSPDGEVRLLRSARAEPPIGVLRTATRVDHSEVFTPGTLLLMYTDGLVERRDRDIDSGLDALVHVMSTVGDDDLDAILQKFLVEMAPPAVLSDDVAMLIARIAPPAGVSSEDG